MKTYKCEACRAIWKMKTDQEILYCPMCVTGHVFLTYDDVLYAKVPEIVDENIRRIEIMWRWLCKDGIRDMEFLHDYPESAEWFDDEGKCKQ